MTRERYLIRQIQKSATVVLEQLVEQSGPLDYRQVARYIYEVALQLTEWHRKGDLHRDLRPGVVKVDEAGRIKLQPSNVREPLSDEALPSSIADYIAPEQALSNNTSDARADIYSLGCVFYFLLTGHAPFAGSSITECLLQHQVGTAPAITRNRPDAPKALVELCERMMLKKREERPQTAAEVSDVLRKWLAD